MKSKPSKQRVEPATAEASNYWADKRRAVNWLVLAVNQGGGIDGVARELKVSEETLLEWQKRGLDDVPFGAVVKLVRLSQMPVGGTLEWCVGPAYRSAEAQRQGETLKRIEERAADAPSE